MGSRRDILSQFALASRSFRVRAPFLVCIVAILFVCDGARAFPARAIESRPLIPSGQSPGSPSERAGSSIGSGSLIRPVSALLLVLAVVIGCAVVLRRLAARNPALAAALGASSPSPSGLITVIGRYPISRGQTLVLMQVDRRVLLLGQSSSASLLKSGPASMCTLAEFTDPEDVASILARAEDAKRESMANRFQSILGAFSAGDGVVNVDTPRSGRRDHTGDDGDVAELLDDYADEPDHDERVVGWVGADIATDHQSAASHRQGSEGVVASLRDRLAVLKSGRAG